MKHIIVPATSANMGSGFDSVGIAFQKYNHLWYVEIEEGLQILVNKKQDLKIPTDESNLIYKTIKKMKGSLFFGSQTSLFLSNPNKGIRSAASRQ